MTARIKDWSAVCNHSFDSRKTCRCPATVIENGKPLCQWHTALQLESAKLRLEAIAQAKKEKAIHKSKVHEKAQRAREKAAKKFFAAVEKQSAKDRLRPIPKESFLGISGRRRAYNLCQRCNRLTESGKSESSELLRFCFEHMPLNIAIRNAEMAAGRIIKGASRSNGSKFRGCFSPETTYAEVCAQFNVMCLLVTTKCLDELRKWEIARIRCRKGA